ncbi:hypothetical protein GS501_00120 [Saccharibacter sp. 17.LH.SD]|uniref:hypothetical protein n=1 Tax=Saccharibacter sp. 17.LH.SD TaxID=2689393 RepID=UPI0013720F43|nr:hypothetical protein [Saccharibacter sp. 17.LH.SD]MXV43486.1 hypothetical protein [Saccharibacter sp. 17.LH.SD]
MSTVVEFNADQKLSYQQAKNRRVGQWLTKLASYVAHSKEFREKNEEYRGRYWAELVAVMVEAENIPDEAWSADAIRFCRRRFTFFPSAAELCAALAEFSEPLRAAQRKKWEKQRATRAISSHGGGLSVFAQSCLRNYHRQAEDGFQELASLRGTHPAEARRAALSFLRQQSPEAYETLGVTEQKDRSRHA